MVDVEELKREAKKYIRYEKDVANRIAYLTFDRPESLNAMTAGMRQVYAELVFKANIDDEVKVVACAFCREGGEVEGCEGGSGGGAEVLTVEGEGHRPRHLTRTRIVTAGTVL